MKELLEKYPKAAKIVKDYYLDIFMKGLEGKDFPEEYIEHVKNQGLPFGILENILEDSPRALFDVFDKHGLPCSIIVSRGNLGEGDFEFSTIGGTPQKTRIEAEKDAIKQVFKLLEEKL